jgi:hypothetical protein
LEVSTMQKHLEALRRQEITFDQFARATASDWTHLAGKLYMAWRSNIPAGVELNDIRQEMLFHAWKAVSRWDPTLSDMTLKGYVVCIAWQKATRFIHKQRCSLRRGDKAPSRHALTFTSLLKGGDDAGVDWVDNLLQVEDDPTGALDAAVRYERAVERACGIDLYALVALRMAGGNIPEAGQLLFEDPRLRLRARWGSPRNAVDQVEQSVRACCA